MAKTRTRVILPGGIQGLVHNLQNGGPQQQTTVAGQQNEDKVQEQAPDDSSAQPSAQAEPQANEQSRQTAVAENAVKAEESARQSGVGDSAPDDRAQDTVTVAEPAANDSSDKAQGRGRRPKQNTMKEYHIVKDDSKDSWQLFLDMAKQYKDGGGKLATIYIDGTLKNVLDRMKYAGPEKLSTSAILSSIVARFIYDHEDDIRKVLFSGQLL